jgi:hypothetical protein
MADGTYRTAPDAARAYLFRTIDGRRLVIQRLPYGAEIVDLVRGQMVKAPSITPEWQARLGTYEQVDALPSASLLVPQELTLRELDGLLLMDLDPARTQVLTPGRDQVAFTSGVGASLGRGNGLAVVPSTTKDGRAAITYLGVTYARAT